MIAKQVITRLEHVHKCGVLYRDIKPHNFLIGVGEEVGRIYLVDFGLSKRYLDAKTGDHYKCKIEKGRGIAGTVRYSSPFLHDGYEASRRDDLFALGYVLMHLLRGDLPWLDISHKDKKVRNKRIGQKKADTSDKDLCSGFPPQFVEYFRYMRSVGFYDKPDYDRLQGILDKVLKELKLQNDLVYDWSEDNDARPKKKRKLNA
jgi:serine/threonine protein kinase